MLPNSGRGRRRGFTLVEVLVWVGIAAIVAYAGAALVGPYAHERKLRAAAERVAAALEFGREVARHDRRDVAVTILPAGAGANANQVRLTYVDDGSSVASPWMKSDYRIDFDADPRWQGISVLSSDAGTDHTLVFDLRGEPMDPSGRFVLGCGDARQTVRVEAPSGRVVLANGPAGAQVPAVPLQ